MVTAEMREFTLRFRAMNTDVLVTINAGPDRQEEANAALEGARWLFAESEAVMSRFRADSELSLLNRSAGRPFRASWLLFQVVSEAVSAASATGGIFDPTVLRALLQAGYDRSFELLPPAPCQSRTAVAPAKGAAEPCDLGKGAVGLCQGTEEDQSVAPAWTRIGLEPGSRTITLPAGTWLDLGGIGKGWTVDRVARSLCAFHSYAIDAGGDLYAAGAQADGSPWTVGVEDPFRPDRDLMVLTVRDRALATSTVGRRRWSLAGQVRHHLIDPRTGRPADSGVASVTVIAGSVALAEVLAKSALVLGPEAGRGLLSEFPGTEWVMVATSGNLYRSPRLMGASHAA